MKINFIAPTAVYKPSMYNNNRRVFQNPCGEQQLAAKAMIDIEKEQRAAEDLERQKQAAVELVWARARRDLLLTRHPTNWAGCSLLQVPNSTRSG